MTSRKTRPIERKEVEFRDAWLIIVAVEGTKTEKWYFELFQYELDENDQLWPVNNSKNYSRTGISIYR